MPSLQIFFVILKLDFEKALDKIEHQVILEVMKFKGFPDKWIKWIDAIQKSSNSSVLLNGIPGKHFACRRGVRQGGQSSTITQIHHHMLEAHVGHFGGRT